MPDSPWHAMEPAAALAALDVDASRGLSAEEARRRLDTRGPNELERQERASALALFLGQFKNVLILILLAAVTLSFLVGEVVDAAIILAIVVFCAVLGFVQEFRAERALEALKQMLAPTVAALRDGREQRVETRDLVPGDILLLEAGDRIPADARILESHSLRCDEAPLTGESAPVGKSVPALPADVRVAERRNMLFAGTTLTYGRGRAVVAATAMDTELGRIAREVLAAPAEKTPLERRTAEIGKWLGIVALAICGLVAGVSILREWMRGTLDFPFAVDMVMFSIALAVAAVPEALAAIVTGALAIGMRRMARENALVRRMPAVETLGCTTVICSDKTGTLTRGEMTVRRIWTASGILELTGAGYAPEGRFTLPGGGGTDPDSTVRRLLLGGLLCNDAALLRSDAGVAIKGDPTEAALVVAAAKAGLHQEDARAAHPRLEELPFSSERKRMTTVHPADHGPDVAWCKGAPETVLDRCARILDLDGPRPLTTEDRAAILAANEAMAGAALRVLGLACKDLPKDWTASEDALETGLTFLGLAGMMDPPRPEAAEAVAVCRRVHIRPVMITGDHALTAVAVAREVGIFRDGDLALTGEELERMDEAELSGLVDRVSVYARVSPLDKLKIVQAWKRRGEVVAMTGDGVNDAPALKHADIGVAMGITGAEVAKEAADMVLTDDNFATIVKAVELGRQIYDNIKKYLAYLIQCNLTEVAVIGGVVLIMGPEFLPLLPAAILYINLATDGLPALALGVAPPEPDIMSRPPRKPTESVFSWDVSSFILRALLIEIPFFYLLFFHDLGDIGHARTEIFFLFIIVETIIALNCRSLRYSVFTAPPHGWLLVAVAWELVLAAGLIQIPAVREAFGINLPSARDLGVIGAFGLAIFALMEGIKVFLRRGQGREG
ncbi:MAG: cation-translocating P-type ATPase [Thermodesulfobacteriota bacterium]